VILYRKSEKELEQDAIIRLRETKMNNTSEGSRTLSLTRAINSVISEFYSELERNTRLSFLSTSRGYFLDLIGELLGCERLPGESDSNYKYRISNQVGVVAGGNKKSIEVETLQVEHVKKIILKPYTRGIGSYTAYVIATTLDKANEAVENVQRILDKKTSFGILGVAELPRTVPVGMSLTIVHKSGTTSSEKSFNKSEAARRIKSYIDNLDMGEPLIASAIYQTVRNISPSIYDVIIHYININSRPIMVTNYSTLWDEKLYVRSTEDIQVN
jgi:uncharacterized phage protein gp47/JayE